ncbi:MAG: hypothetical protein K5846_10515 [Bacteroidales bacterium]|nr:hypothetical protein [Bacteroidales bacterium]
MKEKLITLGNLSEFKSKMEAAINARNFITNMVNDLTNYYLKSETYTKSEVEALINAVKQFTYESVATLPTSTADTMHKIYLVPATGGSGNNVKDEYITIPDGSSYKWEKIGTTDIDLSGYSTTEQMNEAITSAVAGFKTEAQIRLIVEGYGYAVASDMTTALASKVDKETGKGLSTNDYTTSEKEKLAGIAQGAEVNVLENIEVGTGSTDNNNTAAIVSKTAKLVVASDSEIDGLFGSN